VAFFASFAIFAVNDFDRKGMQRKGTSLHFRFLFNGSSGSWSCGSSQKRSPVQFFCRVLIAKSFGYSHFRDGINDPIEIRLTY
jgi:hypothetical protein